jgi:hypothetical protein
MRLVFAPPWTSRSRKMVRRRLSWRSFPTAASATVSVGYGLKLAVAAGAPVRVADEVMDRLAVPVHGEGVHAPFLLPSAVRPPGDPGQRQSFEPRNMASTDGLDRWELAGSFLAAGRPHWQDYSRAGDGEVQIADREMQRRTRRGRRRPHRQPLAVAESAYCTRGLT